MRFLLFLSLFFLNIIYADVYVSGYTRSNGTYVSGHYRSSPNHTKSDNFSTYGNVNPYTGKVGTKTYYDYNNYGRSSSSSGSTSSSHSNTYSSDYVRMTPNNANYITMGSSKDDVLSVQGTPKAINKYSYSETWRYEDYSTIEFKGNKVNEWTNNGALNVK
jgi:hypothetical protein